MVAVAVTKTGLGRRIGYHFVMLLGAKILMLAVWAGMPAWLLGPDFGIDPTTTALVGLALLLITTVLNWEDVLAAPSAWDTLIWFAALVGVTKVFSQSIQAGITHMELDWRVPAAFSLPGLFLRALFFRTTAHT